MATVIEYTGSSIWGLWFIMNLIAFTNQLASQVLITVMIAAGLVPLSSDPG
jgi:hypothetical protein